jgi:guanylate kinase
MRFKLNKIGLLLFCLTLISSCCNKNKHYFSSCYSCHEKQDKPIALVISAPSGCGKDTAINALVEQNQDLSKIISVTTRAMRSNEKDHFDYHFITRLEFDKLSKEDKLLQEATVYGDSRGTLKSDFDDAIKAGKNVIFNTDSKGFEDIKSSLGDKINVVGVFILPPSKETLKNRLNNRGTEKPEVIEYRMGLVNKAMEGFESYNYKIIGESKEETLKELDNIYKAEKIKSHNKKMINHGKSVIDGK